MHEMYKTRLAGASAVVGGIVAGEVIKVISGSEAPLNNALFFVTTQSCQKQPT